MLIAFFFAAVHQSKLFHRDPRVLMDKYYQLRKSNPDAAKKALLVVLQQDANYLPALREGSQLYLYEQNLREAQPLLMRLHRLLPNNNQYRFQLGYLYYLKGEWQKATALFLQMKASARNEFFSQAQQSLKAMASYLPNYNFSSIFERMIVQKPAKNTTELTSMVCKNQQNGQELGKRKMLVQKKTDRLKQRGYTAISQGHSLQAIEYFKQDYILTHDASDAMQLGYLYDGLNDKPKAYSYFQKATKSTDPALALNAQNALTHLAGLQTKTLTTPYYGELFFNPFTQTRFGLTVRPMVARLGVEQKNRLQTKEYLFLRRTDDNRSESLGKISQIYEDDVQVTGMGVQVTPIPSFTPLIGFFEAGAAYDLVYRDRDRWRSDFRGGLMYYQDFGKAPAYYDRFTTSYCYYSDWYGDMTYFSRYNNNVIGGIRTHQGIRLFQYHSSMLNLYMVGRVLGDTQHVFYNNFAEVGPGIAFVPSNRFNVQLRFEHVKGAYLPASSIPPNPYAKHYTNNFLQLLFYVKI